MGESVIRPAVIGAIVWLVVCNLGGYVVVARLGTSGSVVELLIGFIMGVLGALGHLVICFAPRLRAMGVFRRTVFNWACSFGAFTFIAVLLTDFQKAKHSPGFWSTGLLLLVLYVGLPMLVVAFVSALLTRMRTRIRAE